MLKKIAHFILYKSLGLGMLGFGVLGIIAYVTYTHDAPSLNTAGKHIHTAPYIMYALGDILMQWTGIASVGIAIILSVWGIKILNAQPIHNLRIRVWTICIFYICTTLAVGYFNIPVYTVTDGVYIYANGLIGSTLYMYTLAYAPPYDTWITLAMLSIASVTFIYTLNISPNTWKSGAFTIGKILGKLLHYGKIMVSKISTSHTSNTQNMQDTLDNLHQELHRQQDHTPPKRKKSISPPNTDGSFQLPPADLLQDIPSSDTVIPQFQIEETKKKLNDTLIDFKVKGEITNHRSGPVVTTYELELAPGVRENRVIGLSDDIARTMGAESIRISRIPGRTVIGIEIPNFVRETVSFKDIIESDDFQKTDMALPMVLGRDVEGKVTIADLATMPHLLIAGTTGSGKSVGINGMILSLLYRYSPEDLKIIMVDPKMLEFAMYENIPHLLCPVVTEASKAIVALKWTVNHMNERYRHMSKIGVRNIHGYNAKVNELTKSGDVIMDKINVGFDENGTPIFEERPQELQRYPYIVVIVDEMADLMLTAGKDINDSIQSLAQKARAAGIHIILATQRPSTDVITGTIRANFPARIAYRVTSKIDSRVILNDSGGEQLLGRGDMLFSTTKMTRNHAPFVQDSEVQNVCDWLRKQAVPEYNNAITDVSGADDINGLNGNHTDETQGNTSERDALYDEAVALVSKTRKASTSFIQRSLRIGYNRAANLIEQLEQDGIVSPADKVGKRTVLAPERHYD